MSTGQGQVTGEPVTQADEQERVATFRMLAGLVKDAESIASQAKRRMWSARDEVTRLHKELASAESERDSSTRDYEEARGLLQNMFEQLRQEWEDSKRDESADA